MNLNSVSSVLALFIIFSVFSGFSPLISMETPPSSPKKTKTKALLAGLAAQKRRREKEADDEEEKKENIDPNSAKRIKELEGVYTRNAQKFAALMAEQEPHRAQALLGEARSLTPYLSHVHYQQYPTTASSPDTVSPLKQATKYTKPRKKKLAPAVVAAARRLFSPEENWSYQGIAPWGYTVQQRDELIDPFQEDEEGVINLEHMLQGNAPYGPDFSRINLHHVLRQDPGPLAELSGTFHRRETGPLHGVDSPGIGDRRSFDEFRRMYWEGRAFDILESMGLRP